MPEAAEQAMDIRSVKERPLNHLFSALTLIREAVTKPQSDIASSPSTMVNIAIAGATGGTRRDLPPLFDKTLDH